MASQLDYFRERGAAHCPDETSLRQAVEARLDYDPFLEWSPRRVVVQIMADGTRLSASLRLVEGGGIVQSHSELSTERDDCVELIAAIALAIAIHLDPDAAMRVKHSENAETEVPAKPEESFAQPTSNPAPLPVPNRALAARAADKIHSVPKAAMHWIPAIRLGAAYLRGLEPHSTLALKAGGSLRYGHFHAITELFAGLPESERYAAGGIRSHMMSATLLPCARIRWFSGCAEAMADAIWTQGVDVTVPAKATLVHVAVGTRLEATGELTGAWAAVVSFDLLRNLTSTSLRLQQTDVWRSPTYRYALGLAVEMRFP